MHRTASPATDPDIPWPTSHEVPLPTADLLHSPTSGQRPIELCDLERLLELSRSTSYTEAAFRMKITESHLRRKVRQLEKAAGFQLIQKNSGGSLELSGQAKSWLRSFGEFHQSLIQLDEAITSVRLSSACLKIGIEPCLAFSLSLWKRLDLLQSDGNYGNAVFRVGDFPSQKAVDDCDIYISTKRLPDPSLKSHLLYMERIFYYHCRTSGPNDAGGHVTVLSSPPITRDRARAMLCGSRKFQGTRLSYADSECATQSLQQIRSGGKIFLSFMLNEEIVPPEITCTPLAEHSCLPVYLTSLQGECQPSLLGVLQRET